MTIIINKYPLESDLFKACIINERLRLVYFVNKPQGYEGEITMPVLFGSLEETRIFFDGYCNALYNDDSVYEYRGEAQFSLELYRRLQSGADTSKSL